MATFLLLSLIVVALCLVLGITMSISRTVGGPFVASDYVSVTDETQTLAGPSVQAAVTGVLTTRTTGTSGSITMDSAGHGITTGSRVDIFWAGGKLYGATVGTVSGTTVPISAVSGGDALPTATTAITVCKTVNASFNCIGDNIAAIAAYSPVEGQIVIADAGGDLHRFYLPAGKLAVWDSTDGTTNPLAGDTPTKAYFSHSQTSGLVDGMRLAVIHHN